MPPEAPASFSSPTPASRLARPEKLRWVPETRFGHWFLGTNVWARYVVEAAISDLAHLLPVTARRPRRILDAGCGPGVSLPLLDRHFQPESIIGLDIDPKEVARSARQAPRCRCRVDILRGDAARLPLPDASVDMVLCHQLLHHVVTQQEVLREIRRVLTPGGFLLLSESCRDFIHSTPVRLLFRHPNEVQKTAAGYQQLVRDAGFEFGPQHVKTSIPFWSLPDWGLRQKLGWKPKSLGEPTEITLVASQPVGA
jgi:SAM-dependent methyltransferase